MFETPYSRTAPASPLRRLLAPALTFVLTLAWAAASAPTAAAQPTGSPDLVISQVYTRGGETGAVFRHDFIEIFNRGNTTVNLSDYTLQFLANIAPGPGGNPPGGFGAVAVRVVSSGGPVNINPGQYWLYQFGSSGNNGAPLPVTADATNEQLNLPGNGGRVALVKGLTQLVQFGCPVAVDASIADFYGYGATTCAEGSFPGAAPSSLTAALRNSNGCDDTDSNTADFTLTTPSPRNSSSPTNVCGFPAATSSLQFESAAASTNEGSGSVEIFVTRAGDVSAPASVQYATSDDTATERADYTTALGTLHFAAGETRKAFRVLITDDSRVEGTESLTLALGYQSAGTEIDARNIMTLSIVDNDGTGGVPGLTDTSNFFVRQHYADFLSRDPDTNGFNFWVNQIEECGADAQCREVRRINVSAAFFLSIEFQQTGYLAYRFYQAAFPESASRPRSFPRYRELWRDMREIGRDVIVGVGQWQQQLEANKQAYAAEFVARPEFRIQYPAATAPDVFVDTLNANAGGVLSQAERDALVAELTANNTDAGRASVLRKVAEDEDFIRAEFNRAFVLLQYFGYLRRNPTDPPDTGFGGYDFWLGKLNQFGGNFIESEMVKAFLSSIEYRQRFAP